MTDKSEEILSEVKEINEKVRQISTDFNQVKSWLYGANGFEGDIPEIREGLKDHNKRIRRIEIILAGLIGTGALTGGVAGLIKLLG